MFFFVMKLPYTPPIISFTVCSGQLRQVWGRWCKTRSYSKTKSTCVHNGPFRATSYSSKIVDRKISSASIQKVRTWVVCSKLLQIVCIYERPSYFQLGLFIVIIIVIVIIEITNCVTCGSGEWNFWCTNYRITEELVYWR